MSTAPLSTESHVSLFCYYFHQRLPSVKFWQQNFFLRMFSPIFEFFKSLLFAPEPHISKHITSELMSVKELL